MKYFYIIFKITRTIKHSTTNLTLINMCMQHAILRVCVYIESWKPNPRWFRSQLENLTLTLCCILKIEIRGRCIHTTNTRVDCEDYTIIFEHNFGVQQSTNVLKGANGALH